MSLFVVSLLRFSDYLQAAKAYILFIWQLQVILVIISFSSNMLVKWIVIWILQSKILPLFLRSSQTSFSYWLVYLRLRLCGKECILQFSSWNTFSLLSAFCHESFLCMIHCHVIVLVMWVSLNIYCSILKLIVWKCYLEFLCLWKMYSFTCKPFLCLEYII
jgi:hypothetical protein